MTALATVPDMTAEANVPAGLGAPAWKSPADAWTLDDLERLPDDGRRYEIIDGSLVMSPSPDIEHQRLARWLTKALDRTMPPQVDVVENVDAVLPAPRPRVLIPDLTVIRVAGEDLRDTRKNVGPADVLLAIEIVSPGSVTFDRFTKPTLYAEAGIPAYWRVERSDDGVTVHVHTLTGSGYKPTHTIRPGETATLEDPWPIAVTPPAWRNPPVPPDSAAPSAG